MRPSRCLIYHQPLLFNPSICQRPLTTVPRRLLSSLSPLSPKLLTVRDIPTPHTGCTRIISLNSPHNRNAISKQLLSELRAQVYALRKQDGSRGGPRVLILASELDEAFCAGADLKERSMMNQTEYVHFTTSIRLEAKSSNTHERTAYDLCKYLLPSLRLNLTQEQSTLIVPTFTRSI